MKTDIILSGVGGQGIVTIGATVGMAALHNNMHLKQSEVHGMSQRGGAVQSHLRISENPIASDLIPHGKADVIISVEPMEGLRYLPYLSKGGWLVTNTTPFVNIPNYPDMEIVMENIKAMKQHIALDADTMAKEIKSPKSSNIIVLGAASPFLNISFEMLEEGIKSIFGKKGQEIVDINLRALRLGREYTEANMN
ncbi:MAG: indolepyruvate oxidoreductase subunit beta [Chloroflexia bacterium]|nr:indolepyruvate oxidoreductase subunit beta [Chloroflexia bacterium]